MFYNHFYRDWFVLWSINDRDFPRMKIIKKTIQSFSLAVRTHFNHPDISTMHPDG